MAPYRSARRAEELSKIGMKCRDRPTDQVDADVGTEHGRKVDRLDDVAIERIHMDLPALDRGRLSFLLLFGGLRSLRRLGRLLGLRAASTALRRRLDVRGRFLVLGIRH